MYSFRIPLPVLQKLIELRRKFPSIDARLTDLANNPQGRATPTNIQAIGDFYTNAGRSCILFNIDQNTQVITILDVVDRSYLYKVLQGKII